MSSSPDAVRATLDAMAQGNTLASLPAVRSVAGALGDAGSDPSFSLLHKKTA